MGEEEHLRPHPTEVREKRNTALKFGFRKRTDEYHYPFALRDYCDVEFHNVTEEPTTAYIGLKAALEFVQKPIIFFICYDVGFNHDLETFVRHVVHIMLRVRTAMYTQFLNTDNRVGNVGINIL